MAERATDLPARVVALWRSEDVSLNAPATVAELDVLGKLLGILLAGDLRALFSLANGMVDEAYDARFVSFWSIAKIERNRNRYPEERLAFADFAIDSWWFTIGKTAAGLVVFMPNGEEADTPRAVGSFSEFLRLYIEEPSSLNLFGADDFPFVLDALDAIAV